MTETADEALERVATESYAYLTTRGRRTGRAHRIEIWFVVHRGAVYFMLAGGGERADWVRNLLRDPAVRLRFGTPGAPEHAAQGRAVDSGGRGRPGRGRTPRHGRRSTRAGGRGSPSARGPAPPSSSRPAWRTEATGRPAQGFVAATPCPSLSSSPRIRW